MGVIYNIRSGKNTKAYYYLKCFCRKLIPAVIFRTKRKSFLKHVRERNDFEYIMTRVNYYNKLTAKTPLKDNMVLIKNLKKGGASSSYYHDTFEYTRWFGKNKKIAVEWGDVTYIPNQPSIVKSRPVDGDNKNSVVMKLDKIRHFLFVDDHQNWQDKENRVIFRGKIPGKEKRERFFNMYFGNPLCDLGDTSKNGKPEWKTGKRTIEEHLKFKFILALEGNDVASNLKWVMSSGSVAVMPKPEYETWFMEGKLIPNVHYIEIDRDFSNFEERINYYIQHEEEALEIIRNANKYTEQFTDNKREKIISLLTLDKYISLTN